MISVKYEDWGLVDYKDAWDRQTEVHQGLVAAKREGKTPDFPGHFILCEHPAVYTLGKSGKEEHLLVNAEERQAAGLQFYKINRGGDITHHGPGQIVGYPILDLEYWYRDVHRYVREIEELIIRTLHHFDIKGQRIDGYTGVWTEVSPANYKKVCAIGVHLSRWVSMHGFALNVNNDLSLFRHIVPCGIQEEGKDVTSMAQILGRNVSIDAVKSVLADTFAAIFSCDITHPSINE